MEFLVLRDEFRGVKGDWELEGVTAHEFAYVRTATNNDTGETITFKKSETVELTSDEWDDLHERHWARWSHR